jgi:hypothetical protein
MTPTISNASASPLVDADAANEALARRILLFVQRGLTTA